MNRQSAQHLGTLGRSFGIVLIAISLTGCLKSETPPTDTPTETTTTTTDTSTTTPIVSDLTTLAPTGFDADVATHLTLGSAAAQVWKQDAVISYVSVSIPTLTPNKGSEVYVFGSASDLDNWFTYSISQETGKSVRAIIPKADYLGNTITPINQAFWSMNYVQALQLAEQNGGAAFRLNNPNPQVTAYLSNRAPRGWLWWTIEYKSTSGQTLSLLMNPYLGGVSDELGNVLVPDRAAPGTTTTTTPSTSTTTQ
ncbi:MAG: hypothetical protein AAB701_01580 [Patescibacteria group bacterium]